MKRLFSVLCAAVMTFASVFALAGCTGGKKPVESGNVPGPESIQGKELVIASFNDILLDKEGSLYNTAAKEYKAKYGGKIVWKQYLWNIFINKMVTLVGSGNSPDIAYCRGLSDMPKLAVMDVFQPVDDFIKLEETNYPVACSGYEFRQKHYALRSDPVPYLIFYNKSILEEYGCDDPYEVWKNNEMDWNWEKFEEIAKACTADRDHDGENDLWGFAGLPCFNWSNSGTTLRTDNNNVRITIKEPAYMHSLEFMKKLRWELEVCHPNNGFAATNFKSGDVAMTRAMPDFLQWNAPDMDPKEVGVVPEPCGPEWEQDGKTYGCMHNMLGLVKGAKNPYGGVEFAKMLTKAEKERPVLGDIPSKNTTEEHREVFKTVLDRCLVYLSDGWGDWESKNNIWGELFFSDKDINATVDALIPVYQAEIDKTLSFKMPEIPEFKPAPQVTFEKGDLGYLTYDGLKDVENRITDKEGESLDGSSALVLSAKDADKTVLLSDPKKQQIPFYRTYKVTFEWQVLDAVDKDNGCDFYVTLRPASTATSSETQYGLGSFGGVAGDFGEAEFSLMSTGTEVDCVLAFAVGKGGGTVVIDNVSVEEIK